MPRRGRAFSLPNRGPRSRKSKPRARSCRRFCRAPSAARFRTPNWRPIFALYQTARKQGDPFESAVLFALRGVLISPQFLFRAEAPNPSPQPRLLDSYALATRLSYFLWASMPDSLLTDLAETGRLQDPEILKGQVGRMLRSPKALGLVQSFVEQWLGTRELGSTIAPDAKLFPMYSGDEELRGDIRYQPVLFFRETAGKRSFAAQPARL